MTKLVEEAQALATETGFDHPVRKIGRTLTLIKLGQASFAAVSDHALRAAADAKKAGSIGFLAAYQVINAIDAGDNYLVEMTANIREIFKDQLWSEAVDQAMKRPILSAFDSLILNLGLIGQPELIT
jgi:hypothetical protein